jgi:hypothetical protein
MKYPIVNGIDFNVFNSPEESIYYAHCLRYLVFDRLNPERNVVEFGSGDGVPVVSAAQNANFRGFITGFEVNPAACEKARDLIAACGLQDRYDVIHGSFFDQTTFCKEDILISDPPFLPARTSQIMDPLLWGGNDGSEIYLKLIAQGYDTLMLMVASYSNPLKVLSAAFEQGYTVQDFLVSPMTIGEYSLEKPVWERLQEMKHAGEAFYSETHFLLAGVVLDKHHARTSVAKELTSVLTSMR